MDWLDALGPLLLIIACGLFAAPVIGLLRFSFYDPEADEEDEVTTRELWFLTISTMMIGTLAAYLAYLRFEDDKGMSLWLIIYLLVAFAQLAAGFTYARLALTRS